MKKLFLPLLILGALAFLSLTLLEWRPPEAEWVNETPYLGLKGNLKITASDRGRGIRRIEVIYRGRRRVTIFSKDYPRGRLPKRVDLEVPFEPRRLGIRDGKGKMVILIEDGSYLWAGRGNRARVEYDVTVDTIPPSIEIISTDHVVLQGGSEAVVYRTSPDTETTGVEVDGHLFRAYRNPFDDTDLRTYIALFSYPYNLKRGKPIFIVAEDRAGNVAKRGLNVLVKPKNYRRRVIDIRDGFLQRKLPEIISSSGLKETGNLLKDFLLVNHDLRRKNEERIKRLTSRSTPRPLWKGGFIYLKNAKVEANFADFRTYRYRGRKVDEAYHLGYDLASLKRAPVPASNNGRVVFTGYNGIYGNTVIIDHGLGLFTLYSHLSSIDVEEGDTVERGQIIGRTGDTGLAGGDHLHFAVILSGTYVTPIEWWDPMWVRNRITRRMELLKGSNLYP